MDSWQKNTIKNTVCDCSYIIYNNIMIILWYYSLVVNCFIFSKEAKSQSFQQWERQAGEWREDNDQPARLVDVKTWWPSQLTGNISVLVGQHEAAGPELVRTGSGPGLLLTEGHRVHHRAVPHWAGDGHLGPLPSPVLPHGGVQRVLALTGKEGLRLFML